MFKNIILITQQKKIWNRTESHGTHAYVMDVRELMHMSWDVRELMYMYVNTNVMSLSYILDLMQMFSYV